MCTLSDPSILKDAQRIKTLENIIDFTPENLNNVRTFPKESQKLAQKRPNLANMVRYPYLFQY